MADISLCNLNKSFGDVEVLHNINLTLPDKKLTVFVGPSGCGKSTLLRLIAGLEEPTSGKIFIHGVCVNDLSPAKRGLAMVFQSYALYPHMTVYDNIAFGLRLSEHSRQDIDGKVRDVAKILHIEGLLDRKPKQLSGGQRQRVAIGRALVRNPDIYLFDEPLSNIDATLRVQMRTELAKFKVDLQKTMVYVTHDQVEAMTLADQIVVLHQGRVAQVGSPLELYNTPATKFVASFMGSPQMNFLPGAPLGMDPAVAEIGIRPEHLTLSAAPDAPLQGTVHVVEYLGSETYVDIRLHTLGQKKCAKTDPEISVLVRLPGTQIFAHQLSLGLTFDPAYVHSFDDEGQRWVPGETSGVQKAKKIGRAP